MLLVPEVAALCHELVRTIATSDALVSTPHLHGDMRELPLMHRAMAARVLAALIGEQDIIEATSASREGKQ